MSKEIEIEAKTMLSKEDYLRLFEKYSTKFPIYTQVNYLLNPIDIPLSQSKLAIRIRHKNDKYEFTTKIELSEGKLEINQDLSKEEVDAFFKEGKVPLGEVYNELKNRKLCDPDLIRCFLVLKTDRFDIPFEDHLISIDKSNYLNIEDYEIECESTSMEKALNYLKEFLSKENIPYQGRSRSKLKRVKEAII